MIKVLWYVFSHLGACWVTQCVGALWWVDPSGSQALGCLLTHCPTAGMKCKIRRMQIKTVRGYPVNGFSCFPAVLLVYDKYDSFKEFRHDSLFLPEMYFEKSCYLMQKR